jgi:ribosome-binding protein aMBF1 (putative translation factor)
MIGQSVQVCQDTVSQDRWTRKSYSPRMVINNEEAIFNENLCARVHRLRNERGWTAAQMATALNVPPERYRKYEYRSPMPHYLLERFALIVGRDIEYVLLGRTAPARLQSVESRRKLG